MAEVEVGETFKKPDALAVKHPLSKYEYRWCRKDYMNLQKKKLNYSFVKRGQPDAKGLRTNTGNVVQMGDLVLMRIKKDRAEDRREVVREAYSANLDKKRSSGEMDMLKRRGIVQEVLR